MVFCGKASVCLYFVAVPYRSEWRYPDSAYKYIPVDAGHICQNVYLAAENLGLGTCGIGAYDQEDSDLFLGIDGKDNFTFYVAPIGVPKDDVVNP
jgi:SagB-type dehydrogenase family enzyme